MPSWSVCSEGNLTPKQPVGRGVRPFGRCPCLRRPARVLLVAPLSDGNASAGARDGMPVAVADVLARADTHSRSGRSLTGTPQPTGFTPLDDYLGGGLRGGELALLGGAQGLGKTVFALQMARNIAAAGGRAVYVCYEHDVDQLFERVLALECGSIGGWHAPGLDDVRRTLSATGDPRPLAERLGDDGPAAVGVLRSYGDRLQFARGSGARTGLGDLRTLATPPAGAAPPLLVIDYLQKVHAGSVTGGEDERVTHVVAALKDLALDIGCPVLAIVASDKAGLGARTRLHHLRGSTALAYEADVALLLNSKFDVVARNHLMFGTGTSHFHDWVVCSVEKNRNGIDGVDMEFEKDFTHARFSPHGRLVTELLADARLGLD